MSFRSAVDVWFYVFVLSFPLLLVRIAIAVLASASATVIAIGLAVTVPLLILPAWLLFTTYYRVDSSVLRIQSGPYACIIPLDQIHTVTAVRSLGIGPALSRHRLKITYGRTESIMVSPQRKAAFLEALGYVPNAVLHPRKQRPNPFALGENY